MNAHTPKHLSPQWLVWAQTHTTLTQNGLDLTTHENSLRDSMDEISPQDAWILLKDVVGVHRLESALQIAEQSLPLLLLLAAKPHFQEMLNAPQADGVVRAFQTLPHSTQRAVQACTIPLLDLYAQSHVHSAVDWLTTGNPLSKAAHQQRCHLVNPVHTFWHHPAERVHHTRLILPKKPLCDEGISLFVQALNTFFTPSTPTVFRKNLHSVTLDWRIACVLAQHPDSHDGLRVRHDLPTWLRPLIANHNAAHDRARFQHLLTGTCSIETLLRWKDPVPDRGTVFFPNLNP